MKKTLYIIILLASLVGYGQTYTTEDKALTGIFEVAGKSKAEIFSAINKWISINYNSPKTVIQLSDGEAGNIIVKGTNEVSYKNGTNILYPNMKSLPENTVMKFNHLIEVNIKDNKYRVTFTIIGIEYEPAVAAYMTPELTKNGFDVINLNGTPDAVLTDIKNKLEISFSDTPLNKDKVKLFIANTKPIYDGINSKLLTDMKSTMLSINKASTTATNDNW